MFVFDSTENIYPIDCFLMKEWDKCDMRISPIKNKNTYLTVVYLHMNNQFRVEKFYVQLTFQIDDT